MKREKMVARRTKLKIELAVVSGELEEVLARRAGRRRTSALLATAALGFGYVAANSDEARIARLVEGTAACVLGVAAATAVRAAREDLRRAEALAGRTREVGTEVAELTERLGEAGAALRAALSERRADLEAEARTFAEEESRLADRLDHWRMRDGLTRVLPASAWVYLAVGMLVLQAYASRGVAVASTSLLVVAAAWAAWGDRRALARRIRELRNRTRAAGAVIRGIDGELAAPGGDAAGGGPGRGPGSGS
ncbi:MAG: hypothetical protein HYZ53_01985 [Planctomycetes bacterium]|nr:hypothetical protein [Planctomycetota bacterium]